MYKTIETLSVIKLLESIARQIHQYAVELNSGVHDHHLSYTLFNPSDIATSWDNLTRELDRQNLSPVFSNKPSQLYELKADYFVKGRIFHVLINVPVKDKLQLTLSLRQALPALVWVKETLFVYNDDTFIANSLDVTNPYQTTIDKSELKECNKYGTTYCCPKRIFDFNRKPCSTELMTRTAFPSRSCLSRFTLIDLETAYAVSKPQNSFDLYTPKARSGMVTCTNNSNQAITMQGLQEVYLPPGCILLNDHFKLVSTVNLQWLPPVNADAHQILDFAILLNQIPEIMSAVQSNSAPLKQILSTDPVTLQDVIDHLVSYNHQIVYISSFLAASLTIIILSIVVCVCRKKKNKRSSNSTRLTFMARPSTANAARQIELIEGP